MVSETVLCAGSATLNVLDGKPRKSWLGTIWIKWIKMTVFKASSSRPWDTRVARSRPHVPWGHTAASLETPVTRCASLSADKEVRGRDHP